MENKKDKMEMSGNEIIESCESVEELFDNLPFLIGKEINIKELEKGEND